MTARTCVSVEGTRVTAGDSGVFLHRDRTTPWCYCSVEYAVRPTAGDGAVRVSTEGPHDAAWRGVTVEGARDAGWRRDVSAKAPRDGVNTVTTHFWLLCHNLDCVAEFFGDDLAFYQNSSTSCYQQYDLVCCYHCILSLQLSLLPWIVWMCSVVGLYCSSCSFNSSYCVVAKPIDLLARYISAEDDDLAIEMHEPYTYLNVSKLH